jgi:L-threonylcarbamoyladenylate synthase
VIDRAVELLRQGRLVAFPTETVYGLGADATSVSAIQRIFAAKGRPSTNPLICHVADSAMAKRYAAVWPETATAIAGRFWPGPITIIIPKTPDIPPEATAGRNTVGLRAPNHPLTLELLRAFGKPIAGPSANKSNHISPTTAAHVRDELGDAVDLILDGGPCSVGIESTVLDLSGAKPAILRPGGVTREQIEAAIGRVEMSSMMVSPDSPAVSPGQQAKHYAPRTPAIRVESSELNHVPPENRGFILLTPANGKGPSRTIVTMSTNPSLYARDFYATLRVLDLMRLEEIVVEMPPDQPDWTAVRDRITRATKGIHPRIGTNEHE